MSQSKNNELNLGSLSINSDEYIRLGQELLRISRQIKEVSPSAEIEQLNTLRRELDEVAEKLRQHDCAVRDSNAKQLGMTLEEYEAWLEQPDDDEEDPARE